MRKRRKASESGRTIAARFKTHITNQDIIAHTADMRAHGREPADWDAAILDLKHLRLRELALTLGINPSDPDAGWTLALILAEAYVAGFTTSRRGRPKTAIDTAVIVGVMSDISSGASLRRAAVKNAKASSYIGSRNRQSGTRTSMSAAALEKSYTRLRQTGGIAQGLPAPKPSNRGRKQGSRNRSTRGASKN